MSFNSLLVPFFLLLLPLIQAGTRERTIARTVFTNSLTPPAGWKIQNSRKLQPAVFFLSTRNKSLPPEYRSCAKRQAGFTYVYKVAAGIYRVILGFAEIQRSSCKKGLRRFTAEVNNRSVKGIAVFEAVGCRKPFDLVFNDIEVGPNKRLLITLKPEVGVPILSNFQIVKNPAPSTEFSPSPSPESPGPNNPITVFEIDAAGDTDRPGDIDGFSQSFKQLKSIANTEQGDVFSRHRFGATFTYILPVQPDVSYDVQMQFAESYIPGCIVGFRIFDVSVYDADKRVNAGKSIANLDVFERAGCATALVESLSDISVGPSGLLAVKFDGNVQNAMVSGIIVTTTDPNYFTAPSPDPSPGGVPTSDNVEINVGGPGDPDVPGTTKTFTRKSITESSNVDAFVFQSARQGAEFEYVFNLVPGAYDVLLGFSENADPKFCSEPGKRVFDVYVNGLIQLEGFDIFEEAGCLTGFEVLLRGQTVGSAETKPMTLKFISVADVAQINYIKISPAEKVCIPDSSTGEIPEEDGHAAHAVPGSYPLQISADSEKSYVDADEDGFYTVDIDGGASHSHFFDAANGITGRIREYKWTIVETNVVLSTEKAFTYDFPLGTTRLKLTVVDNSCTRDEAETTITVTGSRQPGQYCYYYSGLTELPLVGEAAIGQRADFAAVSTASKLGFPDFAFDKTLFAVRCVFFLQVDEDSEVSEIGVVTSGSGVAKVYKGEDLLIHSSSGNKRSTSLSVGLIGFEVVYLRTSLLETPKLKFLVNNTIPASNKIFHDRATVKPILTSLSPSEGKTAGGALVKVSGYGLYFPFTVQFGDQTVAVQKAGRKPTQFFVTSPTVSSTDTVQVSITTTAGITSNIINFSYGGTCDPVSFTRRAVLQSNGKDVDFLILPTSTVIGQDGKIYVGTLAGSVQVVGYDPQTLQTTSHCYSKPIKDDQFGKGTIAASRVILGITFDPRDKILRPYVTTSTYSWYKSNRIEQSNKRAWQNGAVDRLKPGTDPSDEGVCLVYDKRIVSNLPVSNHDHSVNDLLFTNDGDLLIGVGGFTNMGLPGYRLGGFWETHLSAALLIAKTSKRKFDGKIVYDKPEAPRLAKKISGDVDIYATGLRNTFAMTMTGKGDIYATDNGPNCGFGNIGSSCSDYNEKNASKWNWEEKIDWPGQAEEGLPICPYSLNRPDKVLHIKKDRWYGHPNLNRGDKECAWIDPYDDKTVFDKPAPSIYEKPMTTIKSPVTGISEYRAKHFCGELRGELILSTYKNKTTYRMGVSGSTVTSGPDQISENGGIRFVETQHGDLIFPWFLEKKLFVLQPNVKPQASLFIAGAVPFRHGKKGGTLINVGGSNFGVLPQVMIGKKNCQVMRSSDTEITCVVPSARSGGPQSMSVTSAKGETDTLVDAVLYMNV